MAQTGVKLLSLCRIHSIRKICITHWDKTTTIECPVCLHHRRSKESVATRNKKKESSHGHVG
jgi:hypothetical protein